MFAIVISTALALALWAAPASASRWSAVPVPNAAGRSVNSISCLSARSCFALGESTFMHLDGRRLTPRPRPAGGVGSPTAALDCPAAGLCLAVGAANGGSAGAARLAGGHWHPLPVETDLGVVRRRHRHGHLVSELDSVSCPSTATCYAVGGLLVFGTRIEAPILERWDGRRWRPMRAPASGISLSSVSCASARSCVAVGSSDRAGEGVRPVALSLRGRRWVLLPLPRVPHLQASLNSVSCRGDGCVAVGHAFRTTSGGGQVGRAVVLAGRGDRWNVHVLRPPATSATAVRKASSEELAAVSCPPSGAAPCVAVGSWFRGESPGGGVTVTVGRGTVRQSRFALDPDPTAIDCPTASFCLAAGDNRVERLDRRDRS